MTFATRVMVRAKVTVTLTLICAPLYAGVTIVDSAGRPIAGATVTILLESKNQAAEVFGDEPVVHVTNERGALPFDLPRMAGATVVVDEEEHAPAVLVLDGTKPPASITLQQGLTLRGRVVGDGRTPPGPGRVCAMQTVSIRQSGERFEVRRCAAIDGDGSWILHALSSGPQGLEIAVPIYLPLSAAVSLSTETAETWEGTLEPGLRAVLSVEDASGRGVAGASVACDGAVPSVADAHGNLRVALPATSARCRAFTEDGAESAALQVAAPSTELQTLHLKHPRVVTGTLVTNDGSDPAAPHFILLGRIGDIGQSATPVDSLPGRPGVFRVRLPDDGAHAIRVEVPGMLPLTSDWFTPPAGAGTTDLGVLLLRRGAGIQGRVVHASTQAPLAGAVVSLEAQGRARIVLGRLGKASAVTGSDGGFTVAGMAIGSYRLRVAWGDLPPTETAMDLREEQLLPVGALTVHPGVALAGHVYRHDHQPLSAATVELIPSRLYDTEPIMSARTTREGGFGPISVAPGLYRLLVRGDGPLLDQEIEIPPDEESMDVDLDIRTTRLSGMLREEGLPVSGGEVLLQRSIDLRGNAGVAVARNPRVSKQLWSGRSEAQFTATVNDVGGFSIEDVPAGRMRLEYFGRSGQRVRRTIDIGDEPETSVTIALDGWRLQGHVRDAQTETGLAAKVELVDLQGTEMFQGFSGPAGAFSVDRVAPGVYDLVVSAEGYRTSDPLRVVVGQEAPSLVQIRLTRAEDATLDLVVTRDRDLPAAGVPISIVDAVGRQLRAFPTMADGTLHAANLPPGTVYLIWADPLAGVGMSAPLQLRSGPQEVSLRLEPGKDLVIRCEGQDCSGASVGSLAFTSEHGIDLAPFLSRMGAVVYSNRGAAYVGRLAPGRYGVDASSGPFHLTQRLELCSGPGEVSLFLTKR